MDYNRLKVGDYVYMKVKVPLSTKGHYSNWLHKIRLDRVLDNGEWVGVYCGYSHSTRVTRKNISYRTATVNSPNVITSNTRRE